MLLSRLAAVALLAYIAPSSSQLPSIPSVQENMDRSAEKMVPQDTRPANCRVTLPSDGVFEPRSPDDVPDVPALTDGFVGPPRTAEHFLFGSAGLFTVLPADGTWRGQLPSKPHEFVYDNKLPWFRSLTAFSDGPLTVSGKRLDGPGPSFMETFEGYSSLGEDGNAMLMGWISIPVFGCWEITGHYKDQELTFTVWVTFLPKQEQSSGASSPPSPHKTTARRIQIDGNTQAASLVYRVIPELPASAKKANVSGTVVLHAVIGTDGRANELSYVSGPELLVEAAMEAVRWWQYRIAVTSRDPYEAKEVDTTIAVVFPAQGIER